MEDVNFETKRKRARATVRFMGLARVGLGTFFMVVPGPSSRRLLAYSEGTEAAVTFGRMAAGRDLALGLGTLLSSWTGSNSESEWLMAGLLADAVDAYAFVRDDSFGFLPRFLSGFVALGAVGMGAWALKNIDALKRPVEKGGTNTNDTA
jgi:hypothetical protein